MAEKHRKLDSRHAAPDAAASLSPEEQADRRSAIREAFGAVKAGNTVPLDAVKDWIDSWDTPSERPMPQARKR